MDREQVDLIEASISGLAQAAADANLTAALDDFGWLDVLESHSQAAVMAVFGAQGSYGSWSSALHDVIGSEIGALGLGDQLTSCVVLPRPRGRAPGRLQGDAIWVDGILLSPRENISSLVIPIVGESGVTALATVAPDDLVLERLGGLDPGLGPWGVSGAVTAAHVKREGPEVVLWWGESEARGRLALSHQIVATLFAMIGLAQQHVSERTQFGRLVGTFQAVRHKLVDAFVAATAADEAVTAAWESDDLVLAAATVKVVVGRAVTVAAANTQQLLAGIGFTAEHPYHRFMKRSVVLERVLGSATDLAPDLGRQLIERSSAPRLVEL